MSMNSHRLAIRANICKPLFSFHNSKFISTAYLSLIYIHVWVAVLSIDYPNIASSYFILKSISFNQFSNQGVWSLSEFSLYHFGNVHIDEK